MPPRRMVTLGFVLLLAVPWSAAMTVLGLWIIFDTPPVRMLSDPGVALGVGLASVSCGQLVFMVCVCDRVFPRAAKRLVVPAEAISAGVFALGLLASGAMALFG
jgi:hypothetical protein